MFGKTRAWPVGAGLLLGLTLMLAVTQTALGADQPRSGAVLERGAGYALANGAKPVKALQRTLRSAGERPGPIDGKFGPLTERAVRRAQRHSGVAVDGIVGSRTRAALRSGLARLERRLRAAGQRPGRVDGQYDRRTGAAIRRVQAARGLQVNGVANRRTRLALTGLLDARRDRSAERPAPAAKPAGVPGIQARPDDDADGGLPWIVFAIGAVGLGIVAVLMARGVVPVPRRGSPGPAIVPLGKGLELAGESDDPEIGRFRGRAYAVEIPDVRDPEGRARSSRFYVVDPARKLPFWVRYTEVQTPLPPALQAHQRPWGLQGALRPGAAVLGYVTVPTTYPERHAQLFGQIEQIEGLCKRRGFHLVGVVRDEDPGEQGTLDRPGIAYALEEFAAERASALVVSDVTRLGRSRSEIDELLGRLSGSGVSVLTLDPELDTSTEAGKEAVQTIAAVGGESRPVAVGRHDTPRRRPRVRGNGTAAHRQEVEPARAAER